MFAAASKPPMPSASVSSASPIQVRILECGMPLLVEQMAGVRSAAISWLLPAGNASDPQGADGDGWSSMLAELAQRGAGDRDSRALSDAFDRAGVQRSVAAASVHLVASGVTTGDKLLPALQLFADMIVRPHLPADALDAVRSLAIQSLDSLEDDPQHRVGLQLRERHLPVPFNRTGFGVREAFERAEIGALRQSWMARVRPVGSILAVAGAVDADAVAAAMDRALEGWHGVGPDPRVASDRTGGIAHETDESNQTHMAIGFDAPSESDPSSLYCRLATTIFGGETSSRLFTEVRERRSLCYSVNAGYTGGRDRGMVAIYAGSTPERAQETMDTILNEVHNLEHGVTPDEFRRAKIGMKSRLVMHGESTSGRAAAIASDWYRIGRSRSLAELTAEVEAVSLEKLNDWIADAFGEAWRRSMTVCTVGKSELQIGSTTL